VIVVDASVVVEVLLRTPAAEAITERLFTPRETLHAPHLMDVEVTQVLRRYVARGEVGAEHGRSLVALLTQFPITRHAHQPLLARMWELRDNLTAYDAAYVALSEGLRAPLLTRDQRLVSAPGAVAQVELI
jgi:predicted nucleic acid-binding protein